MSRINGDISEKLETTPERIFEKVGSSAKSLWRHLVYIAILDLERKRVDQLIIFAIFISFVFWWIYMLSVFSFSRDRWKFSVVVFVIGIVNTVI